MLSGKRDEIVPPEHMIELERLLRATPDGKTRPGRLIEFEEGTHSESLWYYSVSFFYFRLSVPQFFFHQITLAYSLIIGSRYRNSLRVYDVACIVYFASRTFERHTPPWTINLFCDTCVWTRRVTSCIRSRTHSDELHCNILFSSAPADPIVQGKRVIDLERRMLGRPTGSRRRLRSNRSAWRHGEPAPCGEGATTAS